MAELTDIARAAVRSEIDGFLERPAGIERNVDLFGRGAATNEG